MGAAEELSRGPWDCISGRVRGAIGRVLARGSAFAVYYPLRSLLVSLVCVLLCLPGLALVEQDSRERNFYRPDSYSQRAADKVQELFTFDAGATSTFIFFEAKEGVNLISPAVLASAGRVLDQLLAVRAAGGESYEELCLRSPAGRCEADSVFHYFGSVLAAEGIPLQDLEGAAEMERIGRTIADFCTALGPERCRETIDPIIGVLVAETPGTDRTGALHVASLAVALHLDGRMKTADGQDSFASFQLAMMEAMHAPTYSGNKNNFRTANFDVLNSSQKTREHEASRAGMADIHLVPISFCLILVFVCCAIIAPPGAGRRSRIVVGLLSSVVVVLCLVCSLGVCAYLGVPFTPLSTLLLFTLLGVSVDDIIVIVHAYDNLEGLPTLETVKERIVKSVAISGSTIALTSATSFVAFLCAATVGIPAIRYVSVFGAFGILVIFVLQFSVFLPLFSMEEQRRLRSASGLRCPCCPPAVGQCWSSFLDRGRSCLMQFRHSLAKPVLSAVVVVFFFLAAGLGIWGAVEVRTDSDMTAYFIDDSFALQFLQMREKYWLARAPLDIITEHLAEEGFFSEARLAELDALIADLEALDCVSPPHDNWIWDFQAHIETSHNATAEEELDRLRGDPAAFGSAVADFLKRSPFLHDGRLVMPSHHRRNIRIEGGLVRASRQSLQYDADFSMQKRYISNFQRTHAVVFPQGAGSGDTFSGARVPRTFEVAHIMLTAERDARMKELVFTSLGVACAAVCGVVVFVLNPILGFYIGFLVLSLDAMVLAMLIVYDIGLDVLAYLSVALTLGLVVDYSTHTAHSYLHCDGSPAERLDFSVRTMGASIISAGGSTLLGIMALAAAASEGYRIYFRVLATAVGLGTFFGVLVSPVVLCSLHRLVLWLGMRRHEKRPEPDAQSV